MEAQSVLELVAIQSAIDEARRWARWHFRDSMSSYSTLLDPPCFSVRFPDVDRMIATPMMYGNQHGPEMEYRLRFHKDGRVSWHPTRLLFGIRKLPDLFITPNDPQREV